MGAGWWAVVVAGVEVIETFGERARWRWWDVPPHCYYVFLLQILRADSP
jgi:hypothetical protein